MLVTLKNRPMKNLLSFLLVLCWFTSGYAQDKTDLRKGIEAYKNNDPALALEHYDNPLVELKS